MAVERASSVTRTPALGEGGKQLAKDAGLDQQTPDGCDRVVARGPARRVVQHERAFLSPAEARRQKEARLEGKALVAVAESREVNIQYFNIRMAEQEVAADELDPS